MRQHRTNSNLNSFSNPDVTPLVDLTFLLLIVFMITAPVLEYSIDINPPEFDSEAIMQVDHLIVNLDKNGVIYVDKKSVSEQELKNLLAENYRNAQSIQIFVRADKTRPYGDVIDLMKMIKHAGISDVSLVTESEEN